MTTYDKVKKLAEDRNLTIMAVEKEAGLGNGVIGGWRDGYPRIESLRKVAGFFGVSIEEIIGDKE